MSPLQIIIFILLIILLILTALILNKNSNSIYNSQKKYGGVLTESDIEQIKTLYTNISENEINCLKNPENPVYNKEPTLTKLDIIQIRKNIPQITEDEINCLINKYYANSCNINYYDNPIPIIKCNNLVSLSNRYGTCWNLSIQSILFFSDSVSKCIQYKLRYIPEETLLLDFINNKELHSWLPFGVLDIKEDINEIKSQIFIKPNIEIEDLKINEKIKDKLVLLLNMLKNIKERFKLRIIEQNILGINISPIRSDLEITKLDLIDEITPEYPDPVLRRDKSISIETDFTDNFFKLFQIVKPAKEHRGVISRDRGSSNSDKFFMTNLLSSILLNKLINFNNYNFENKIPIDLNILSNTIGIYIGMTRHACSFYTCNNVQKFCNNSSIIDYNWYNLIKEYNNLISIGIVDFNIYYDSDEYGPYIYIPIYNQFICFQKDITLPIKTKQGLNSRKIISFIFLNYFVDNFLTFNTYNISFYIDHYIQYNKIEELSTIINPQNINILYNQDILYTTPLELACIYNKFDIVKLLIEKGANINILNNIGQTVLFTACLNNNFQIVNILIKKGININIIDTIDGGTALFYACMYKGDNKTTNLNIVKLLIKYSADVNQLDHKGESALFYACVNGNINIIQFLIEQNANINIIDSTGKTALFYAIENNHEKIVELLLKNGANITIDS